MTILIIGSGSGLGKEIFKILKKEKKNVQGFSSLNSKNLNYINLKSLNLRRLKKQINSIKNLSEVYYLANLSKHESFLKISQNNLNKFVNFNILNFAKFFQVLLKKNDKIIVNVVLSHICFMHNYGFSIYRSHKLFQKNLLQSIQIEFPKTKINYIYPGAIKTNFVKNNSYSGKSIFQPKDPKIIAKLIVRKKKRFYSIIDYIFYLLEKFLPEKTFISLNKILLKFIYKK